MSLDKLSEDETGRKGAPCEFIHPLVMGDVMCNEKQLRMGRFNAPLKLRENWDGMMPHRRNGLI